MGQTVEAGIVGSSGDDDVFRERRRERQRFLYFFSDLTFFQKLSIALQLALDTDDTIRLATSDAGEIDAMLFLSTAAMKLDCPILKDGSCPIVGGNWFLA